MIEIENSRGDSAEAGTSEEAILAARTLMLDGPASQGDLKQIVTTFRVDGEIVRSVTGWPA